MDWPAAVYRVGDACLEIDRFTYSTVVVACEVVTPSPLPEALLVTNPSVMSAAVIV